MAVNLSPFGGVGVQFFDNSGNPLTGGKIFTYTAGTTTPQTTYTTSAGSTAHSNPIILDAGGRVPSGGEIWLTDGLQYKFLLKDANDAQIASYDNVIGINSNFVAYTSQQEIQTATAGQTVFTLTTMQYQPNTNNLSVFVDGVNQYGPGAQYAYVETNSTTVTFTNGLHVGAEVKFTTASPVSSNVTNAENVTYAAPYLSAVTSNVEAKLSEYVSVKDFGAVGDGVTDDTAAIQAALDAAKRVYFPAGVYKITTITPNQGNILFGDTALSDGTSDGSVLNGTTGNPIIKLPETATGQGEPCNNIIENLSFVDGDYGIYAPNGCVWMTLNNVKFQNDIAGIYWKGFIQEWIVNSAEFNGGQYGIYHNNEAGTVYAQVLIDKSYFYNVYCSGQTVNGVRIKAVASNNVTWDGLRIVYCTQDGMYLDGGIRYWTIKNFNAESNGYIGVAPLAPITGTINAGSNSCSVSSSGYASNGDTVTIAGAGTNGEDFVTTISSGANTFTWTLAANASTSVVSAEITKYTYSDIKTASSIATLAYITIIDAAVGLTSSVGALRYSIDASGIAAGLVVINGVTGRPIYDANNVSAGHGTGLSIRRPYAVLSQASPIKYIRSFTPGLAFGGASTGITYTTQSGYVARDGNLVYFSLKILLSSKGSATGAAKVTGLPFTSANLSMRHFVSIGVNGLDSGVEVISAAVDSNATTISILGQNSAPWTDNVSTLTDATFGNTTQLEISGVYLAAN